jgi:hypothetical protein
MEYANWPRPDAKIFREVASGAKADRAQLRWLLDQLASGDVLTVSRFYRLAQSTRDLLNTLAAITAKKAGFRSLGDAWADITTSRGRLMLPVLGGLAGRPFKVTGHQNGEAIKRRNQGETLAEIGRSYNVSPEYDFEAHGLTLELYE